MPNKPSKWNIYKNKPWIFLLLKIILCSHTSLKKHPFLCLENSPLSSLQYSVDPRGGDTVATVLSSGSLAPALSTRSNPDHLKRISYSEVALNKAPSGSVLVQDDLHFPGYNPAASTVLANPRIMSRSHHNLGQMPESMEPQLAEPALDGNSARGLSQTQAGLLLTHLQQHQRASSDTDSISNQQDKWVWSKRHISSSIARAKDRLNLNPLFII